MLGIRQWVLGITNFEFSPDNYRGQNKLLAIKYLLDMRRLVWVAMGIALISMVFANCKKEDPTYSVQVTATEGGTVEGQNGEYKEGEKVVFKAIPVCSS